MSQRARVTRPSTATGEKVQQSVSPGRRPEFQPFLVCKEAANRGLTVPSLWGLRVASLWPTWHDDVGEAQFPGDGNAPREQDHVLPPQLLDVAVEELQRHRQAWKQMAPCRSLGSFSETKRKMHSKPKRWKGILQLKVKGWGFFSHLIKIHDYSYYCRRFIYTYIYIDIHTHTYRHTYSHARKIHL